jgi:phosphopantetheinyl transferase
LRWLSKLSELPRDVWLGEPVAWLLRSADVFSFPHLRVTPEDMADAAALGAERGAQRLMRLGMIRLLAARAIGVHPDKIRMERRQDRGVRITAPEQIYVSDAKRSAWSAVAIAREPVGVDVEARPAEFELPFDLLHADECELLAELDPSAREPAFLRFWTAREAYIKATEGNLADSLGSIRAIRRDEGTVELMRDGISLGFAQTITNRNYVAALAVLPASNPDR